MKISYSHNNNKKLQIYKLVNKIKNIKYYKKYNFQQWKYALNINRDAVK